MSTLTFVVDPLVYDWRNAHSLFVDIRVLVIAAIVAMVAHRRSHAMPHVVVANSCFIVASAQRDMKMPGNCAPSLSPLRDTI